MLSQWLSARRMRAFALIVLFPALSQSSWAATGTNIPDAGTPPYPTTISKEVALANDYLFGHGVAPDPKKSADLLEKAAGAGDPSAQMELGYFYEAGIGVTADMERAAHWYQLAAYVGLPDAKANLGMLYFWGRGVDQDREMAARLFREAADKGSGIATYELGAMYSNGAGVEQDKAAAEQWFLKGAKLHNPQAEYQLSLLYSSGAGHKADLPKSVELLRSSAGSGYVPAMYTLGMLLTRHSELAKTSGEAAQFLQNSASAGVWNSSEVLGILARDGIGMPQDDKAAYLHFRIATLQGGGAVQDRLKIDLQRLTSKLDADQIRTLDAQANDWYQKHTVVLEFIYTSKDSQLTYPNFALAMPKDGEHELQLLSLAGRENTEEQAAAGALKAAK